MIVDAHLHAFPDLRGASGYADARTHALMLQNKVAGYWGRMVSSTLDEKCKPLPNEEVGFRVGRYGRYYWTKNAQECWLQRFPLAMEEMEWSPERMIAYMDAVGVDVGVLQAGYMEMNFCRKYFAEIVRRWPSRFVSTVAVDYDLRRDARYLECELDKLRYAVCEQYAKGVFQGYPKGQPIDEPAFDPFWRELCKLDIPHIFLLGFEARGPYLKSLRRLERLQEKFPELNVVIGHLGGNVRPPRHPDFTNTPEELIPILRSPNAYFEVGYVMAYENKPVWGRDYEYPYPKHNQLIERVYEEIGAERLLWGSDMPNLERSCSYLQCKELVSTHCDFLTEAEKEKVLGRNAARLFHIPEVRAAAASVPSTLDAREARTT